MTLSTFSLPQLRAYASKMGIAVEGNKTMKATYVKAIEAYEKATVIVEDAIEDIRPVAEVVLVAAVVTAEVVVDHAIVAYQFYTSPKAVEVYKAIGVALLTLAIALGMGAKKAMDFTFLVCRAAWNTPTARKARRAAKERLNNWTRKLSQRIDTEWIALVLSLMVLSFEVNAVEISDVF